MATPITINSTAFQRRIGDTLWEVTENHRTVVITRHDRELFAIVPMALFAAFLRYQHEAEGREREEAEQRFDLAQR